MTSLNAQFLKNLGFSPMKTYDYFKHDHPHIALKIEKEVITTMDESARRCREFFKEIDISIYKRRYDDEAAKEKELKRRRTATASSYALKEIPPTQPIEIPDTPQSTYSTLTLTNLNHPIEITNIEPVLTKYVEEHTRQGKELEHFLKELQGPTKTKLHDFESKIVSQEIQIEKLTRNIEDSYLQIANLSHTNNQLQNENEALKKRLNTQAKEMHETRLQKEAALNDLARLRESLSKLARQRTTSNFF